MHEICPHCGARLPAVSDAFCSECRSPIAAEPLSSIEPFDTAEGDRQERGGLMSESFTLPGRILILISITLAMGGPWMVPLWLGDSLGPGKYPFWYFAFPVWVGVTFLFVAAVGVLKWLDIPIYRQPEPRESTGENSNESAGN